ncbi:hypothetical protein KKB11_03145, partial [Candidatus Micrarchaeota archaeon]|nr:hypothetical protein [Candidatus Micrarchaeota archaeon]
SIMADSDQWNNINKAFGGHPKYEFANKTAKDYTPGTFANWDHYETVGDGLQFYKLGKTKVEKTVGIEDLEKMLNKGETRHLYVKVDDTFVEIDHKTIDFIKQYHEPGEIELYSGSWVKDNVFQPEEMGDLMSDWGANRIQKARTQNELLWNTLRERNWAERRYFNAMDRVFANEERLANAYFRTAGGAAKYTVYPYVYWQAKRGFGFESMSAYMLPESWSRINYSAGTDPLYDDAYIDFFANAGSDQGDLFARLINNLPWKYVLNAISEKFNPVKDQYDKYTQPDGGVRSKVGNIAVYSNTSDNCASCGITLTAPSQTNFTAVFKSENKTSSIILEDTPVEEKEKGATLINYAHHLDLTGVYEGQEQKVSLSEALKDEKINTCQQAIEKAGWGVGFANDLGINAGGYLAATEAAGYLIFGMGGMIFSVVQQFVVASKVQDCVDTTEGYYTHFFVPPIKEEESPKEDTVEYSTQKVSNFIDDASAQMEAALTGSGTVTQDAVNTIRDELDSLSGGAKSSDLVQATYDTFGFSRGMMQGIRLFYFWAAGGTNIEPSKYKTDGQMVIQGTNDQNVISDNKTGQLIVDGVPVLTSEDHVRLASTNLAGPHIAYPQTLTNVRLSGDANELVFKLKVSSDGLSADLIVESSEILDCIKDGVMKQTGLPLNSDNLSEAFGKFQEMKTDSHSSIYVQRGQIIAEGIPRKVALTNPGLEVFGDRSVKLINSKDNDSDVGLVEAVYFENGFVLYKPETNELIFWLKHHEQGKLEQNDVFGLDVTPKTQINPVTGCEEYVFDASVLGDPDSPAKQAKVDAFNQSLEHMEPFNVFRTDKKTYIFYEDKDCVVRLKIIDNETGDVLYDEAVESIVPTDDGFNVKTADGQTHDFGFSTEDGRPFLDYNGVKELLRSIGGQNGSMWYDPEKGMWYAENAQLLPLLDLFRQQGIKTTVDDEGNVKSVPGENLMNININDKTASNPFNLPSLPENALMLSLFILGLISFMLFTQFSFSRKKN